VQEAQATALVIQAQAEAERISDQANALITTPSPAPTSQAQNTLEGQFTPTPITPGAQEIGPTEALQVEIMRVSYAADGGFITIYFRAPPEIAEGWWQGDISIIEEETETEYNEVPVMPKIGPLISKPQVYGQVGYVMLVNNPPGLKPGARVTVILGEYRFENIIVE
jgi:hypothetical protein